MAKAKKKRRDETMSEHVLRNRNMMEAKPNKNDYPGGYAGGGCGSFDEF